MADGDGAGRDARVELVTTAAEGLRHELVEISLDIHDHPELNYEEHHASGLLADALERHGVPVERGVGGVETAFRASLNGGAGAGPTVAILAEYDALPDVGHGCGHNLLAISTVGAFLAAKPLMDGVPGRVTLIGTPAEEGGGGKIRLLAAGVFDGIDVALSSHPSSNRTLIATDIPISESRSLAMVGYRYAFHGKAAHAAAMPHEGINALNSVIHLFTGIDAMRQHLRDDVRIHGYISDGGRAANVVPEFAAANFMLRARNREYLRDVVVPHVRDVAEGAARMTGARLDVSDYYPFYENVRPNAALARTARANADAIGLHVDESSPDLLGGASTDFGNVSQAMPSTVVMFAVGEDPVPGHSQAMVEAARSNFAHRSALEVVKVLALTACDVLESPAVLAAAREEFVERGAAT